MVACTWLYPVSSSSQTTLDTTKHTPWDQLCVGRYETKKEEDLAKGFKWVRKGQTECAMLDFVGCVFKDPNHQGLTF